VALLVLPLAGCIEDRLSVELFTQIHGDGSCRRRVTYRLERVDTGKADRRVAIPPDEDPLRRLHRFPTGGAWYMQESTDDGVRLLVLEASLPSPNAFDGDYSRARTEGGAPARNYVSGFVDPAEGVYEYREALRDPVSLLTAVRLVSRELPGRDQDFARAFLEPFQDRAGVPPTEALRRLFREDFAEPFARDVATIARRPVYGLRERRALENLVESLDDRVHDLAGQVAPLAPDASPGEVDEAVSSAVDAIGESLAGDLESTGLAGVLGGSRTKVSFRATLVMPHPIYRANTCAMGDTAVWEFDGEDLAGPGFEMTAIAVAP